MGRQKTSPRGGKATGSSSSISAVAGAVLGLGHTALSPPCQRETSAVVSALALDLTKGTAEGTKLQGAPLKRPPHCDKAPKSLENEGKGSGRGLAGGIKGSAALEVDLNHILKQPTAAVQ